MSSSSASSSSSLIERDIESISDNEVYIDEYDFLEHQRHTESFAPAEEYSLFTKKMFPSKVVYRSVALLAVLALIGCAGYVIANPNAVETVKDLETSMGAIPFSPNRLGKNDLDVEGEYIRTKDGKFEVAEKEDKDTDLPTMHDVNHEVEKKRTQGPFKRDHHRESWQI